MSEDAEGQIALVLGRRDRGEKVRTGADQGVELKMQASKATVKAFVAAISNWCPP